MRAIPDRWNLRVRLRDWLLKPTAAAAAAPLSRFTGPAPIAAYHLVTDRNFMGQIFVSGMSRDHGPFVVGPDGVSFVQPGQGDQ